MRIYGSVQISFWEDSNIQSLADQSKLLAVYLLTGPHSNMLGCFRLPDGYITEDLKWNIKDAKIAFDQLSKMDFLTRDPDNSWLIMHQFLKWNPIQNPRQGIGIQKLFDLVPRQSKVFEPLINGLLSYGKYLDKIFLDRLYSLKNKLETVSEDCLANKEQDREQKQDTESKSISNKGGDKPGSYLVQSDVLKSQAKAILQFLNDKANRAYRPVDSNIKLIMARLNSGATVMECRQVIAKKTREWKGDVKMTEYLRPATLFNAVKFEQYIGELINHDSEENNSESLS